MVQAYYVPQTVEEAAGLLEKHAGKARIMAGGTDLVLDIKDGKHCPEYLVDITKIKELKQIEAREQTILIGAGVTHNQAAASALVQGAPRVWPRPPSWWVPIRFAIPAPWRATW